MKALLFQKCLVFVTFFFQISQQTKVFRKNQTLQKFLFVKDYFSEVSVAVGC